METRSKRQQTTQRPAYPQLSTFNATSPTSTSSTASSAFQSSSSLTSYPSPRSARPGDTSHSAMYPSTSAYGSSVPLPSPLAQHPSHYFGSIGSNTAGASHVHQMQSQASSQHASSRAPQTLQQHHQHQHQQPHQHQHQPQHFTGQRGAGGGMPETAPFLNNFNLVAEAAKRAQMDCLMRDLNDVEL